MRHKSRVLFSASLFACLATGQAQSPPNVSQVVAYSGVVSPTIPTFNSTTGLQDGSVTLANSVPNIFSGSGSLSGSGHLPDFGATAGFQPNSGIGLITGVLNQGIATALSVIPISSPASGVITKTDPLTGGPMLADSTLGPIFTERAETIGKNKFYIGFSHQDYHFTSFNGQSLNGLQVAYTGQQAGGDPTNLTASGTPLKSYPVTVALGLDVRLSQDIAFLTYGISNRIDLSVGLPMVHASVAAFTYNGTSWDGGGNGALDGGANGNGTPNCWCATTFAPGTPVLKQPDGSPTSLAKTGFGDLILRMKGTVVEKPGVVLAVGGDLRLPTGDAQNYLGAGATSVKPFLAVSFFTKPSNSSLVLSPHATLGWQFVGKSILGGTLVPSLQTVSSADGPVNYYGAPFTATKDYLPDVLSWSVGAELAIGRHNTIAVDVLGNQIGLIHGMLDTKTTTAQGFMPCGTGIVAACANPLVPVPGLVSAGRTAIGEYSGSIGYKARVAGNLVVILNALIRIDNNSLVSRFTPLIGLGYTFGGS